jgi:nucleoside-diphosphate-sugar epimerase
MKNIVVTGGSGKAGNVIIKDLLEHSYDVINVDIVKGAGPLCPFRECDATDYGQVFAALHGCDAVVHMASDPRPDFDHFTGAQRFQNNTLCTYNVFNAATALGLKRVVWASSETIHGFPFDRIVPEYLPVDEAHIPYPQSSYALSKLISEEMARQFNRLTGISFIGLRFSNILYPDSYQKCPEYWADPLLRKFNLWSYVDARDVAQSVRLSLEADLNSAEVFIIAAEDTIMNRPSAELVEAQFPGLSIRAGMEEYGSLISIEKARKILGYRPQHSWRNHVQVDS